MAAIRTLLNPLPIDDIIDSKDEDFPKQLPTPTTPTFSREFSPTIHSRKKQKICKDAAVFTRGPVRGECRYPPYEYDDDDLSDYHRQFEMYPMGEISEYPRRIPYNSEKKSFLDKTGRECLEVFQYRFKVPGDDKTYTMLWDYNIGLVRTTPLFKCCGYSKTTPAKMLNRNIGLRDICHSITGGALVAQGYWMPYEAAKAVAATFCWSIRFALTPVFGIDFPKLCIRPDSDRFGEMLIDPEITKRCTEEAQNYRESEVEDHNSRASSVLPGPPTPDTPTHPRHFKRLPPKAFKTATSASGYSTDTSRDDHYSLSPPTPQSPGRINWATANIPRSVPRWNTSPPVLRDVFAGASAKHGKKRLVSSSSSSELSSPALSPKSRRADFHEAYDSDSSSDNRANEPSTQIHESGKESAQLPSDEKAAYLLMNLKLQNMGPGLDRVGNSRKRRAST